MSKKNKIVSLSQVSSADIAMADAIADWCYDYPGFDNASIARAFEISGEKVTYYLKIAVLLPARGRYLVRSESKGKSQRSADSYASALLYMHAHLGLGPSEALSWAAYEGARLEICKKNPHLAQTFLTRAATFHNHFGSWNNALTYAGLPTNDAPDTARDAQTPEDAVIWIAIWLRHLANSSNLVYARRNDYAHWARTVGAPGIDRVSKQFKLSWYDLLLMAVEIEATSEDLPSPKPVSDSGANKNHEKPKRCAGLNCSARVDKNVELCPLHKVRGANFVPSRDVKPRTRNHYLVYWPQYDVFKIGIEIDSRKNHEPKRIEKWLSSGAILVGEYRLTVIDSNQSSGMHTAESNFKKQFKLFPKPAVEDWLGVVGATDTNMPDGYTETWYLPIENTLEDIRRLMEENLQANDCSDYEWIDGESHPRAVKHRERLQAAHS